jgi:hypothetical protein
MSHYTNRCLKIQFSLTPLHVQFAPGHTCYRRYSNLVSVGALRSLPCAKKRRQGSGRISAPTILPKLGDGSCCQTLHQLAPEPFIHEDQDAMVGALGIYLKPRLQPAAELLHRSNLRRPKAPEVALEEPGFGRKPGLDVTVHDYPSRAWAKLTTLSYSHFVPTPRTANVRTSKGNCAWPMDHKRSYLIFCNFLYIVASLAS